MRKLWFLLILALSATCAHAQAPPQANILTYCTASDGTVAICPSGTADAATSLYPQGSVVTYCLSTLGAIVPCPPGGGSGGASFPSTTGLVANTSTTASATATSAQVVSTLNTSPSSSLAPPLLPAATIAAQGAVQLPVTASSNVLPRINVSVCTFVTNIGNSIDAGVGATATANSWVSMFDTLICPNAFDTNGQVPNRAVSGTFMSDNINFGILLSTTTIKSPFALNVPASNSGLSTIGGPDNEDNNTDALNANQQVAYQQQLAAGIILRGIPTIELYMIGSNTGTTFSTTTTAMDYYSAIPPAQTMSSAGETATHSFISYGGPIYTLYNIYPSDTGTMRVSIDGNLVTDTITGSSTLANAPYSGADFLSSSGFTQTLAAARFTGIGAGTHTIVYTCVTPGTNGCAPQITATPPWDPTQYSIPTVAVRGAIRQLGDAKSAATAAYDALVTGVVNPLYADGLNVVKIPVRNFLNLNNYANAMANSDGHNSAAIVNTAITVTSGSATITGTGNFDGSYVGMLAYCLNTATVSTTLYATVKSWTSASPTTLLLNANAGVSGTVTCWFGALGNVWPASTSAGQHPDNWGHLLLEQAVLSVLQPVTIQAPVLGTTFTNFTKGMVTNVNQTSGIFNMNYTSATPGTALTSTPYCGVLFGSQSNAVTSINIAATCFSYDTIKSSFFTGLVSQFNKQVKIGDNNVNTYQNGSFRWDFVFDNSAGGTNGGTDQGIFFNNGLDSYTTTTLASASTLGAPASKFINVTGTTAITAIPVPPGSASLGSAASSPAATSYEGCIYLTASGGTAGANAWSVTAGATILTGFQAVFGQQYQGCYDGTNWRFTGPGVISPLRAGVATLVAGTATVSTASACAVGSTCNYKLTNCGGGSAVIGTLSLGAVSAGTSFVINSLTAVAGVSADTSLVCWQIN